MKQFCKLIRRAISRWKDKRQTLQHDAVEIQGQEQKKKQNASSSSVTSADGQAVAAAENTLISQPTDCIRVRNTFFVIMTNPVGWTCWSLVSSNSAGRLSDSFLGNLPVGSLTLWQADRCSAFIFCLTLWYSGDGIRVKINSS